MNILFHCSEYPIVSRNGGIGTVTKIVAEELACRGHRVYVAGYYPSQKERVRVEGINGVDVYSFNLGLRKGSFKSQAVRFLNAIHLAGPIIKRELRWYENKLQEIIELKNVQILELTDFWGMNGFRCHLNHRRFNVPTILRVHGCMSFINSLSGEKSTYAFWNDKNHFKRTDYLSSVSYYSQQYIEKTFRLSNFKGRVVLYNPIETIFLKRNEPSNNKRILFIGKIIKTKGAFEVVKAFNIIAQEYPDWELRMVGKGDIERAKSLVSMNHQDKVHFLGFCDRKKIMEEIDGCSFACIPTLFENFSMVPLEIMGRSRTVIFTNRTSGNEIISNGDDGYTVNPEDLNEICDKIRLLIENAKLRNVFAQKSFEKVSKQFTVDIVVDQIEAFYSNCINDY